MKNTTELLNSANDALYATVYDQISKGVHDELRSELDDGVYDAVGGAVGLEITRVVWSAVWDVGKGAKR